MELQVAEIPVALVLCGLPELNRRLGQARPQVERLFRGLDVGRLNDEATREALVGPLAGTGVSCPNPVADRLLPLIDGYPHFVQLFGSELWRGARARGRKQFTAKLVTEMLPEIERRIETDIYDFRMTQMSIEQRDLLLAASQLGDPPPTATSIAETGLTLDRVGTVLEQIEDLGILEDRADRGEYFYTVPGFHAYLVRRGERWTSAARPANAGSAATM